VQGRNDILYDFAQLTNGNLVFVGFSGVQNSGTWAWVTDSTGKKLLWEKKFYIQKHSDGSLILNSPARAVCATPDNGFTIVGLYNRQATGDNAFAAHFIPVAPVAIAGQNKSVNISSSELISGRIQGNRLLLSFPQPVVKISLYSFSGRQVTRFREQAVKSSVLSLDISDLYPGAYLVRLETDQGIKTAKVVVGK
jgi:hypothetical protein